jgi:hypothetical protein
MNTVIVGYDLNRPGQNYDGLIEKLTSFSTWWHHLDSTWLIKTAKTAVQVRDELKPHIDQSDELLVVNLADRSAAWTGFSDQGSQWLKDYI